MSTADKTRFFWRLIRAYEWWNYKLPLPLAVALALASVQKIPPCFLLLPCFSIMAAGIVLAVYASVFNDLLDIKQDKIAGKKTPMMRFKPWQRAAIVALSVVSILLVGYSLSHQVVSVGIFASIWALYTAYSLPPIRLKERGAFGVLSIAVGEHLLANLLAVFLLVETTGCSVSPLWLMALCGWSVAYGCRGIIWHQLSDIENDKKAGCTTLGTKIGAKALRKLGEWYIFPIEVICFFAVLALSNNPLSWMLLVFYLVAEWLRSRYIEAQIVIVAPMKNPRFALLEYYQLLFPLSFLLKDVFVDRVSSFLSLMFILLFSAPLVLLVHHLAHIYKWRAVPAFNRVKLHFGHGS